MKRFFTLVITLQSIGLLSQNTLHVNQNIQGGLQNGLSWADAFSDLQQAFLISNNGDEIWVAKGTYYPTNSIDRSLSFVLKNGVILLEGFIGTEISAEMRDPIANQTQLSGNIGNPSSQTDNAYHVLQGRGLDESTILDGFII